MSDKHSFLIGLASFVVTGIAILSDQWLGAGLVI